MTDKEFAVDWFECDKIDRTGRQGSLYFKCTLKSNKDKKKLWSGGITAVEIDSKFTHHTFVMPDTMEVVFDQTTRCKIWRDEAHEPTLICKEDS